MLYILDLFQLVGKTVLIDYYGWVLFVWVMFYMWYYLHIKDAQKKYAKTLKYIFLEVKIDQLNERSPFAMEQIFAALHAIHQNFTWGEKFNGKHIASTSCEIVSLGGRVSYIFKMVDRYRNLFESSVFAQYPKAEIVEVEDYLKNLPKFYDPETAEFDFWGTQMNKRKDGINSCYPIRSYAGFEHKEQDTFVDPLAAVIEVMSNLQPYELLVSQLVFKPDGGEWKKSADEKVISKLRGNPAKKHVSRFDIFLEFPLAILNALFSIILPGPSEPAKPTKQTKDELPSLMMHLSEGQKGVIAACERQMDKISYEVKLRLFYLAPKDKFNRGLRIPEIIGAYRNFDEASLNGMKPDVKKTWTDATYKYIESLEKPLRTRQKLTRKRKFLVAFKDRDHFKGTGRAFYNSEEMATMFHFPQALLTRVSQVEKVETVKTAPPANLPIGQL